MLGRLRVKPNHQKGKWALSYSESKKHKNQAGLVTFILSCWKAWKPLRPGRWAQIKNPAKGRCLA